MPVMRRWNSLYFQLLILIVFSAVCAGGLFVCLNSIGNYVVDKYYAETDYAEKQDQKYIVRLQEYVTDQQLNSGDTQQITQWVKKQRVISLEMYVDNMLIYDSANPKQEFTDPIEVQYYDWNEYYTIQFLNEDAIVSIYGVYDYQMYNYAFIIEIFISIVVFLALVAVGIHKKMDYIMRLRTEIEILEGGNLEYPITVKGKDELAVLANGLDCMRQSFREQVIQEAEMVQENQRIITEMSHDLRTPITSIMLYTTILKRNTDTKETQIQEYLNKIEKKAGQMKQLTDHLFEYSLVTGNREIKLEEPSTMRDIFYDLFSETSCYLEQKGLKVQLKVEWSEKKISICTDYIMRIMDNITSNMIKYANPNDPILIQAITDGNMQGFSFENSILPLEEKIESTGIGINSIKNMMLKMGGKCIAEQKQTVFCLKLLFPTVFR